MATYDKKEFIKQLPKAELHVHLEGCLTSQLARDLALRNKVDLPETVVKASTPEGFVFHDLTSLLAIYYPAMEVLQTSQDFEDLAMDYLRQAHEHNVKHCELFFGPQAHTSRGVSFPTVVSGYQSGILRAGQEFGISAALIMCFQRDMSSEYAMATLMEAIPFKDIIIGVGLDSDERDNPPVKFEKVFKQASQEGFLLTAHCDVDEVNSIEHIRQALEVLKVHRLDHSTNIVEDQRLIDFVKSKGIGLTCCPISNSIVTSNFKGKEIVTLLRQGVKVTINSDDPAYFRSYANENMLKMATDTDVSKEELIQLQRNAFEISWISSWRRDKYLAMLDDFERQFA